MRQFFFSNMSTRAAKMLVDDMQALGPVRLRDVDEAQTLLVNIAKDLAAKGEILIAKSRGDDEADLLDMTRQTAKYLFDEDFATGAKPTITLVEAERRRADAESQAYRKGFAAGEQQAQSQRRSAAAALTLIADGMERLHKALAGIEARLETEAVEVAVAVAGKLAPELIAREPFAEISALATSTLQSSGQDAACRRAHRRRYLRNRQGQARGNRARARLRGPAGGSERTGHGARRLPHRMGRWRGSPRPRRDPIAIIDDVVGRYVAARASVNT